MLRRLTKEKLEEILEAGIAEFGEQGLERTSMSRIAARVGTSVGVLYKYYKDKDDFFLACVRKSLRELDEALSETICREEKLRQYAERLIEALQRHCREHPSHIRMYHELTSAGAGRFGTLLAQEIEGVSSRLYSRMLEQAQREGNIRRDADPKLFAFFFDNLLMMLQFSCCCGYYRERFRLYCGSDPEASEEHIRQELLKFLESAFTLEETEISHQG